MSRCGGWLPGLRTLALRAGQPPIEDDVDGQGGLPVPDEPRDDTWGDSLFADSEAVETAGWDDPATEGRPSTGSAGRLEERLVATHREGAPMQRAWLRALDAAVARSSDVMDARSTRSLQQLQRELIEAVRKACDAHECVDCQASGGLLPCLTVGALLCLLQLETCLGCAG